MTDIVTAGARSCWVLVAPAISPEDVQGRPDLYLNTEAGDEPALWEWEEEPCMATEFTDADRAALDLSVFDGDVEWCRRSS